MPGMRRWIALIAVSMAVLAAPAAAHAAIVTNGDFETGSLSGWQTQNTGSGWFAYSGTASPTNALPIAAPPQGSFAAVTDQVRQGTRILYQDVALEPGQTHTLSLYVYYKSNSPIAHPATDSLDYFVVPNQQYRIDVMKPSAPLTSINPADILLPIFRTATGDPTTLAPTMMTADLTPFAGQTVRLRFAEVDGAGYFNASTDAVSIASTPPRPTGQRAAALASCKKRAHKHHWSHKRLKKCKKKANLLPL